MRKYGASEGIRTLDIHLGKVTLYQTELRSLPNKPGKNKPIRPNCKPVFGPWTRPGCISIFEKLRAQATSSKFQTPSSKEAPGPKHQTPSSKLQRSSKLQARSAGRGLELGTWDFFGVWSLVFGVSIPGFLCLVFRSAVAQQLRCGAPSYFLLRLSALCGLD